MVGPLIPTYSRIEPVNVGGMELLVCPLSPIGGREVRDAAPTQLGHGLLPSPCPCRAASRQLIKASPAKGFVRKQIAPAFKARARAFSTEKAVMKMNGTRYPSESKWACSSRPLIVGIWTSAI